MPERILLSWSGGKDSAMALHELLRDECYEVVALLTSVSEEFLRISHHGVRDELLTMQADAIGIPLERVYLPSQNGKPCPNEVYEARMADALRPWRDDGVCTVAHGDLFLEDLRTYRERNLARLDMRGIFPLWKRDTAKQIHRFLELGFEAYLSCVEGKLGRAFAGRRIDRDFLRDLPADVDPCGEYGEYHSFVYAGPIYPEPLPVALGEIVLRDTRYYADIVPRRGPAASRTNPSLGEV